MFKVILVRGQAYLASGDQYFESEALELEGKFTLCADSAIEYFPSIKHTSRVVLSLSKVKFEGARKFIVRYNEKEHIYFMYYSDQHIPLITHTKASLLKVLGQDKKQDFTFYVKLEPEPEGGQYD